MDNHQLDNPNRQTDETSAMRKLTLAAALLLAICSCATQDPGAHGGSSNRILEGNVSEGGWEIIRRVASNPDQHGEVIGSLPRPPSNVQEAMTMVSELLTSLERTWPGAVQAGTQYEDLYFLSSLETLEGLNAYDSGYFVSAVTGEVRYYHSW